MISFSRTQRRWSLNRGIRCLVRMFSIPHFFRGHEALTGLLDWSWPCILRCCCCQLLGTSRNQNIKNGLFQILFAINCQTCVVSPGSDMVLPTQYGKNLACSCVARFQILRPCHPPANYQIFFLSPVGCLSFGSDLSHIPPAMGGFEQ